MKKLVLIRHGESEWNKQNLFTGWTDVDLSSTGRDEAHQAGRDLVSNSYDFDVCFTSYLKRAIHTLDIILDELDRVWLPVYKTWQLNERHYGALQGLNKSETNLKFGEDQVKLWRRSFNIQPPALEDEKLAQLRSSPMYKNLNPSLVPACESLENTLIRVAPFWEKVIKPQLMNDKRVLVVAHGNSIRALVKHLEKISDEDIASLNIPTGTPLVYEFDDNINVLNKFYLGNASAINEKIKSVESQAKVSSDMLNSQPSPSPSSFGSNDVASSAPAAAPASSSPFGSDNPEPQNVAPQPSISNSGPADSLFSNPGVAGQQPLGGNENGLGQTNPFGNNSMPGNGQPMAGDNPFGESTDLNSNPFGSGAGPNFGNN